MTGLALLLLVCILQSYCAVLIRLRSYLWALHGCLLTLSIHYQQSRSLCIFVLIEMGQHRSILHSQDPRQESCWVQQPGRGSNPESQVLGDGYGQGDEGPMLLNCLHVTRSACKSCKRPVSKVMHLLSWCLLVRIAPCLWANQ